MCGLVGVVYTNEQGLVADKEKFLRCLLLVDQLRGDNSTGIFVVQKDFEIGKDDVLVYKRAMNASDFLSMSYVNKILGNNKEHRFFAGHNRFATKGSISNHNAHPFQIQNITLMHNGTINSFGKYSDEVKGVDVDSLGLTYLMYQHGLVDTLKEVNGSYALVWHDAKDNTLNMIRNSERPLYLAELPFGYAWASELWMIQAAAMYASFSVKSIASIPEFTHHKFCLSIEDKKTYKVVTTELHKTDYSEDLRKKSGVIVYNHGWQGYHGQDYDDYRGGYRGSNVPFSSSTYFLNRHNLKIGEEVEVELTDFDPNSANGPNKYWGTAYGYLKDDVNVSVMATMLPAEFFEMIAETGDYTVTGKIREAINRRKYKARSNHDNETYIMLQDVIAVGEGIKVTSGKHGSKDDTITIDIIDSGIVASIEEPPAAPEASVMLKTIGGESVPYLASAWVLRKSDGCEMCGGHIDEECAILDNELQILCQDCATRPENAKVTELHKGTTH